MRKCAVCGNEFEAYEPIEQKYIEMPAKYGRTQQNRPELLNRLEYSCPYCYSPDRDRMVIMFLKKLRRKQSEGIDILEIAPSGALQRYLNRSWGKSNLYTADLFMEGVDYPMDIQNMQSISDQTFDFFVCSHVLEHVKDDRMAMRELYRVLDKKGLGILLVPMDLNQTFTDEEWGLSEEENWRRFGQGDHVRKYNKEEFIRRLEESGFYVHLIEKSFFSEDEWKENALEDTSTLYLVYKNKRLYKDPGCIAEKFARCHSGRKQNFKAPDKSCNFWLDACEVKGSDLTIWGWAYILNCDSQKTRFKLALEEKSGQGGCIYGLSVRKREDIQSQFGSLAHNYACSGIDVQLPVDCVAPGTYAVFVLMQNGDQRYKIVAREELELGK